MWLASSVTSQNGRMYQTQSASVRMRNHMEHSFWLFKWCVTTHFSIFLNSHSHQVQHALKAWTMGEYVEPKSIANHFLANNYSDHTERKTNKGRTINVLVHRATQYMSLRPAPMAQHSAVPSAWVMACQGQAPWTPWYTSLIPVLIHMLNPSSHVQFHLISFFFKQYK